MTQGEKNHLLKILEGDVAEIKRRVKKIEDELLDPDVGLYMRVRENTFWRKISQWLISILILAMITAFISQFWR